MNTIPQVAFVVGGCVIAVDVALSDRDSSSQRFDQPIESVSVDISSGSIRLVGTDATTATVEMSIRSGIRGPHQSERVEDGRLVIESS